MSKRNFVNGLIIGFLVVLSGSVEAQKTRVYHSPEHEYKLADELFLMQQYGSAKNMYRSLYHAIEDKYNPMKQFSLYREAICACLLFHEDAEKLALFFMSEYPEYDQNQRLWFYLAGYYFDKKQYKKALEAYEQVEMRVLADKEEEAAYRFKKGYCYFVQDKYDRAKPLLLEVKSGDSQYASRALFYYSHILYVEKSYHAALQGFTQLQSEETYAEIVPFYIAHIYFATQEYEKITAQANELLAKSSKKRLPEINHIVAQSYFMQKNYTQAVSYYEAYLSGTQGAVDCEDYYSIGYSYYADNQYDKAIPYLTKAMCENDSLKQYASFVLANCYLETQQKDFASRLFYAAYELDKNPQITEDALFNYAKLQYELSNNPFVGAISAFEQYINNYPNAMRKNEAESFLSTIYLTTKNYKAAIASLEKIKTKSPTLLKAYQRVACFRGMELFNDGSYNDADTYLDIAMLNNFDPVVYAQATFWKAEIAYRKSNYAEAAKGYDIYLSLQKAKETQEYAMAFYNSGYAYFQLENYRAALSKFTDFQKYKTKSISDKMLADAYNRMGDCYYMLSDLQNAYNQYNKVIEMNAYDVDYALYQKAMTEGYMRNFDAKIATMKLLENKYPKSPYLVETQYEIAKTYYERNQNADAVREYTKFIDKNPRNPLAKKAMLDLGTIYYNTEQDEKALEIFKSIVKNYPNTDEAVSALKYIESIYIANGNVEEFFPYVQSVSPKNITVSYQDSVTYKAASEKYFNRNFADAEKGFDAYVKQFPQGTFITNAHFYLAECAVRRSDYEKALPSYEFVIKQQEEQFLTTALLNAAEIYSLNKEYNNALTYLNVLEHRELLPTQNISVLVNKLHCYYGNQDYANAISCGETILKEEKANTEDKEQARTIIARSALELKNYELAATHFTALSKQSKSEIASEAMYYLAFIEFAKGNTDAAEKKIFEIIANISHDYWQANSYILLGDIYVKKGNTFQAKYTYLSIMENYDGDDDLKQTATDKYNKIIAAENADNQGERENENEEE
ncbi:MAG: tetratricopeptide repeat protein [Lentimicrobiaceae bacterium]|nr:tetratricopeptide repeat protein [Lentimicrobiaceae bacterium]